ncbi:MAG: TonB-dependent receptor [Pseudoxanthomonas sp.]
MTPRHALCSGIRQALSASLFCFGLAIPQALPAAEDTGAADATEPAAKSDASATLDTVHVIAAHEVIEQKKNSAVVKDSVIYDEMDSYSDETLAEILTSAPGISAIEDGGEPRYLVIRGVQPELNYTTIDGISLASVGDYGSGQRQNNLQLIPSDIGTRTDIYKTFSAEQTPDAIGGWVDIISRSAFDRSGQYIFADTSGIYSTADTADVGRSAGGNHKTLGHWGKSAKVVYSDQFGADKQFGIVAVAHYQQRSRNSVKRWVESNYFYDEDGNYLTDGDTPPTDYADWNGLRAPGNYSTGTYTNYITNFGGSVKLEWKPADEPFYASLLMYSYRFYENSTMNKTDLYSNAKFDISDQTDEGGTEQINSIYTKNRHNRWDRQNMGAIAKFDWDLGERSRLTLRAGHTEETFDDTETYWAARTYPSGLYVDYVNDDHGFPNAVGISDSSLLMGSSYKLSTAYVEFRKAKETIDHVRLDYSFNIDADAKGFGFASGAEYRRLDIWKDTEFTYYKLGSVVNDYLYAGSTSVGTLTGFPLIDNAAITTELIPTLAEDTSQTYLNADYTGDYKYVENISDAYFSAHYAWDRLLLLAGLRYDHTTFDAFSPYSDDGGTTYTGDFSKTAGGYNSLLPSFNAVWKPSDDQRVRFSVSRTLGRPRPNYIAQAKSTSCGEDDDGSAYCTISQGNPALKPRKSTNFDLGWDLYFNGNNGLVAVALFDKEIKDDIYTLTTYSTIDDVIYKVTEPLNADKSSLRGIEFAIANRNLRWGRQHFDLLFNATRLYGETNYRISDGSTRHLDRLLYQPDWTINGSAIWRMPWKHAQLRLSGTYRGRMLSSFGDNAWLDEFYDPYMTWNLAFSHQVSKHFSFKYEAKNIFNRQPTYSMGPNGKYRTEIDDYGRFYYFDIVYNY